MLLQRFEIGDNGKLHYEYMGSANYERGAAQNGRDKLVDLAIAGKLVGKEVRFIEQPKNVWDAAKFKPPIETYVFSNQAFLNTIPSDFIVRVICEPFFTDNPRYAAWMRVGWPRDHNGEDFDPLLIVRLENPAFTCASEFMEYYIKERTTDWKAVMKANKVLYTSRRLGGNPMNFTPARNQIREEHITA